MLDHKRRSPLNVFLTLSLIIVLLSACMPSEQKEIVEKAEMASLTYFKETYGIDVEFTGHRFIPSDLSHTVSLTGHVKGNTSQEIFAMVDYDTYEVKTGSVPDDIQPLNSMYED
ncbi:hypothetical protein ASD24_24140 [Paenibacillus sp. Root52]|uniref:hypothetical protein n=1 Tax=Paenibacillus sp. Root52 TaxID=1736552 RepID=UPI0006F2BA7F|nr:hypothetical protein [Paenibacillus sp. Root52]KQY91205.1 hypothetical protein ASD24_24140 [Paenibacillus sp. Root52]